MRGFRSLRALLTAVAAGSVAGCVPSPYLSVPDPGLDKHLEELSTDARTLGRTPEETLYLEARAFDLYRPRMDQLFPTPQSAIRSCLTEVGFGWIAPLVGGDLGVYELRRRTPIGAAQFYEEFLRRSPERPLAPRALYRLGWTYRNVMIGTWIFGGQFEKSSDDAFKELERRFPESPEATLAPFARHAPSVDPFWIEVLSGVIPGAGQIYCGETKNGLGRFALGGIVGLTFLASARSLLDVSGSNVTVRKNQGRSVLLLIASFFGIQLVWSSSVWDAERSALAYNEGIEEEFERRHPLPSIDPHARPIQPVPPPPSLAPTPP